LGTTTTHTYTITNNDTSSGRSTASKAPPQNISILINNDATSTASTAVTLNLTATGATEMLLSNPSDFVGAVWEPFVATKSWTLHSGVGVKTVWARFRDSALDTSASISDSITLVEAPGVIVEVPATTTPPAEQTPGGVVGCENLIIGDMVKVAGKAAIYALNQNLQVLYFPSGDEFKSWRPTYGGYRLISQECFDLLKVPATYPGAMNYHPGSYVIKRPSSDQLYVVEPNDTLAKTTPELASALYGATYKTMTVSDVFWPHYVNRGPDLSTATAHPGMLVKVNGTIYYIDAVGMLRQVTSAGMTANGFQDKFVQTLPASAIAGMSIGDVIDEKAQTLTGAFALNLNL
jgi:hypothetical protein